MISLFRRVTRRELAAWAEIAPAEGDEDTWTDAMRPVEHAGRQPYDTGRTA